MRLCLLYFVLLIHQNVNGLWDKEINCPKLCTCRLEHFTETAIRRFMQQDKENYKPPVPEAIILESNDVFYDDDEFDDFNESSFIKSATCIVQTETTPKELMDELPDKIQSITLIQASESKNKTIQISDFSRFAELQILEIQSAQKLGNETCYFHLKVDQALEQLEYLNLERVLLKTSIERYEMLGDIIEEDVTFEYVQKVDESSHPLTFVQQGRNSKILPYKTYVENIKNVEVTLFKGFSNMILLRIYDCQLNTIQWEMFEGLGNLNTLILEKNNLRFIPDFAFYGTPNLKSLSLAWNNLLNIQITDLAGLLELEYLDLSYNNFSQLSELSLPPFPKLKLANFANNPITVVFPHTFEVMNTTNSLILGSSQETLCLLTNSFLGLKLLRSLKLLHVQVPLLKREVFVGMQNLRTLVMTGNISEIEYDAFTEIASLDTLILNNCNITKLSIDSFIGLNNLRILDLSKNNLDSLPPGIFDDLSNIREIYLGGNKFQSLPKDIFSKINPRLIRLNENPWHCSCDMSNWKPMIVNRIKQKSIKTCDNRHDKGQGCTNENIVLYKFVYENRVAPKCSTPKKFRKWSVFHIMRKQFKCPEFKPKLKKKLPLRAKMNKKLINSNESNVSEENSSIKFQPTSSESEGSTETYANDSIENQKLNSKFTKLERLSQKLKLQKIHQPTSNMIDNVIDSNQNNYSNSLSAFESNESHSLPITNTFWNKFGKNRKSNLKAIAI